MSRKRVIESRRLNPLRVRLLIAHLFKADQEKKGLSSAIRRRISDCERKETNYWRNGKGDREKAPLFPFPVRFIHFREKSQNGAIPIPAPKRELEAQSDTFQKIMKGLGSFRGVVLIPNHRNGLDGFRGWQIRILRHFYSRPSENQGNT
jgi:hypothetical protein